MTDRISIYLAAPLFNHRERAFNELLAANLYIHGNVFLPQRDGALLIEMLKAGVPQIVAERRVFEQDRQAMTRADVLVAILDGAHIDEGVAFEIGFSTALGKVCVGLQTDIRRALIFGNNPMIGQGLTEIFDEVEPLVAWVQDFARAAEVQRAVRA